MPNTLIITCGTSQIDGDKINVLGLTERDYAPIRQDTASVVSYTPGSCACSSACENMVKAISTRHQQEGTSLFERVDTPLGAELATLHRMREEIFWNPNDDRITLLATETRAGVFCADVIEALMRKLWGVPDSKVKSQVIPEMKESPANTDVAAVNIVRAVLANLQPQPKNLLVMTGGFKSLVPPLSMVSFLHGIELVYLFERSTRLQVLNLGPDLVLCSEDQGFWQKTWRDMQRTGYGNHAHPALRAALQHRVEHEKVIF